MAKLNPFKDFYRKCYLQATGDFPLIVDVELTNQCNYYCLYCPRHRAKREKGMMRGNVWVIVLNELKKRKTPVRFVRFGEPTLHPYLYKYIAEAHNEGLLTHLTTNGSNLDIDRLGGLDSIKFSLHDKPEIQLVAKALYDKKKRPHITVSSYDTADFLIDDCADEHRQEEIRDVDEPPAEYVPCPEVFSKLSVNWDGTVSACCGDYDNMMIVGDVKEESLESIWNSERLKYYRDMLRDFRHSELELCKNCIRERWNETGQTIS